MTPHLLRLLALIFPFALPLYAVDPNGGGTEDPPEDEPDDPLPAAGTEEDPPVVTDGDEPPAPKIDPPVEEGMMAAIKGKIPVKGEEATPAPEAPKGADGKPLTGAALAAHTAKVAADAKAEKDAGVAAAANQTAEAKAAAEAAAKQKREDEAAARIKGKKVEDFALTKEERKSLSQGAQQRFHDLHRLAKGFQDQVSALTTENTGLTRARDEIMGALEESQCDAEDLTGLLQYNLAIKTGKWDQALAIVEEARAGILQKLGREAPGVDLLKDFPDLTKDVEDELMSRERALEIAKGRRRETEIQQQQGQQSTERQRQQALVTAKDTAATAIEGWVASLAAGDIDYKAKERMILAPRTLNGKAAPSVLDQVMKEYHPSQWLATLKMIYGNIQIQKAATPAPVENGLRPSGSRAGAAAPSDMAHAIAGKLGYENIDLSGST